MGRTGLFRHPTSGVVPRRAERGADARLVSGGTRAEVACGRPRGSPILFPASSAQASPLFPSTGAMFLTALLCRGRIPGRQWIGKHRRPRTVSALAKQNMIRRLEIEAENHYWLSRPFLTAEQERGHAAARRAAAFEALKAAQAAKFPAHRRLEDQLDHLNVTRRWS